MKPVAILGEYSAAFEPHAATGRAIAHANAVLGLSVGAECSLAGREMDLRLAPGSQVAAIYGATAVTERYHCNFGVHPDRVAALASGPLRIVGADAEGEVRVVELPGHRFFIGTLYVPQAQSTASRPHPLVCAFLQAVAAA